MNSPRILFFDGECGLCHRAVRFAMRRDPEGELFRFAPLGGRTFENEIPPETRERLPDSLVLLDADGLHVRAGAALRVMRALGRHWRALAGVLALLPRPLLDWLYDVVARGRHRIFAKPASACPVPAHEMRERLLP